MACASTGTRRQYHSTPVFANTGYVRLSTLSAAFPSGWQQTAPLIKHYLPVKPKGPETPSWGLGAVLFIYGLQICKSCLNAASIVCSSMGKKSHLILKAGHLTEHVLILTGGKKKEKKNQSRSCPFIFHRGFFHLLLLRLV